LGSHSNSFAAHRQLSFLHDSNVSHQVVVVIVCSVGDLKQKQNKIQQNMEGKLFTDVDERFMFEGQATRDFDAQFIFGFSNDPQGWTEFCRLLIPLASVHGIEHLFTRRNQSLTEVVKDAEVYQRIRHEEHSEEKHHDFLFRCSLITRTLVIAWLFETFYLS
jgi:hypothetical protein